MCPTWTRVADEIESLARDRALAASVEPDPREQRLLDREATLLHRAAECAESHPGDGHLVHTACEGVVVHCERFIMWGISEQAERELRSLARTSPDRVDDLDPLLALMVVLGVPADQIALRPM